MRKTLISGALAMAATVGLAAPAFAIDATPCWPDNGQLKISYYPFTEPYAQCYRNAGSTNTDLPGAYHLRAGNNSGYVDFIDTDGVTRFRNFNHWSEHNLNSVRIIKIRIY